MGSGEWDANPILYQAYNPFEALQEEARRQARTDVYRLQESYKARDNARRENGAMLALVVLAGVAVSVPIGIGFPIYEHYEVAQALDRYTEAAKGITQPGHYQKLGEGIYYVTVSEDMAGCSVGIAQNILKGSTEEKPVPGKDLYVATKPFCFYPLLNGPGN